MIAPLILFVLCLASLALAIVVQGPAIDLWSAASALGALAALGIVIWAGIRGGHRATPHDARRRRRVRPTPAPADTRPAVLVDGSNVMFWEDEIPRIATVVRVVRRLETHGYKVGVMFDANAGYRMFDRYLDDAAIATLIDLPEDQVLVVPKGTIADEYLLNAARAMKARIVTNDRYRDWAEKFPEVRNPGRLIKGEVVQGKVRLWDTAPKNNRSAAGK